MKKFGLIGGTSWRSTVDYYDRINSAINALAGDNTNPRLNIASLDQKRIHDLQRKDDWPAIAQIFADAAIELANTGVEGISLCANTPHKCFSEIQGLLNIPVLHIGDAIAIASEQQGWKRLGLIGTRFTMNEPFIKDRLTEHGLEIVVPSDSLQRDMQKRIYDDLSVGNFGASLQQFAGEVIQSLQAEDVNAVILGCTEFPLLLRDWECQVPLIDSIEVHCDQIVKFITEE